MRYRQALLLSALAVAPAIHAETLYVIEQVVVNVNSAPDATGQRVSTIKSGEPVEVLGRQGDQIHVHLPNGTEGWVRKSYLSADEPLQQRLAERNGEVEKLRQDVARLEGELAAAHGTVGTRGSGARGSGAVGSGSGRGGSAIAPVRTVAANTVGAAKAAAPNTASTAASEAASTAGASTTATSAETNSPENDPATGEPAYFMTPPEGPARPVWHWALGSFVVALALGFVLGWYGLDRRIRRKYGGLRIY